MCTRVGDLRVGELQRFVATQLQTSHASRLSELCDEVRRLAFDLALVVGEHAKEHAAHWTRL